MTGREKTMDCPKCGYAMSEFDTECPRCKRITEEAAQRKANYGLGVAAFFACIGASFVAAIIGGIFGPWGLLIGTVVWMGIDSSRLARHGVPGFSPVAAVLGGLLLWVVVLPWYLVARDKKARVLEGIGVRVEGINGLFVYAAGGWGIALLLNLATRGR
jgi:hypothetical protein